MWVRGKAKEEAAVNREKENFTEQLEGTLSQRCEPWGSMHSQYRFTKTQNRVTSSAKECLSLRMDQKQNR